MENELVVSVQMITYGHEAYIKQAVESVLMQKTDFEFDLIIADDCSPDTTPEIINEIIKANPKSFRIKYFRHSENIGMQENGIFALSKCMGKYIAICEGDDYWTDPYKLQKQVDFLENSIDYGLSYTLAAVYVEKSKQFKKKTFGKSISSIEELLLENSIPTPTVLFRKEIYLNYEKIIKPLERNFLMGDYPIWLYFTSVSKIKCLNYPSSVYRVLENSAAHSSNPNKELLFLESYHAIKLHYLEKLNCSPLEKKIWGRYFSNKAYIYLLRSEQNISDLICEIDKSNIRSLKIRIIKLIISNIALSKILKLYWLNK